MWKILAVILIGDLVTVINCQKDTDGDGLSMLYLRLFPSKAHEHKSSDPPHEVHVHVSNHQDKFPSKGPTSSDMLVSDWDIKRLQDLLTALHVKNYKKTLQQNRSQAAPMFVG